MSKTCECGHHRDVHLRDTSCASPELCMCRKFVEAKPVPSPKRLAEMTASELRQWVIDHDADDYTESFAALRDAILAERDAEHAEDKRQARAYRNLLAEFDIADERVWEHIWKLREELDAAKREVGGLTADRNILQASVDALTADLSRSRDAHHAAIRERDNTRLALYAAHENVTTLQQQLRTAESALGEAKREGAREALTRLALATGENAAGSRYVGEPDLWVDRADMVRTFRDREYPATDPVSGSTCKPDCARVGYCAPGTGCHATPSGEGVTNDVKEIEAMADAAYARAKERATPQPEATLADVIEYVEHLHGAICQNANHTFGGCVPQKFADFLTARRLLALAQTGEGK